MKYAETLKKGTSTAFRSTVEPEDWKQFKAAGIDCIELSFNYEFYMETINFPKNAEKYAERAKEAGIELWSIHLPFSPKYDISSENPEDREEIIRANELLIEAAGRIGIKTAVLHPSSEPIDKERRAERFRLSREGILYLKKVADRAGVVLAVENLPRTCLCNKAPEMIELLKGTGATVVFDTNHSLFQDNISFMNALLDAGLKIRTLHISDYDFVDERHRLPGTGVNNWKEFLNILEKAGYDGPLMYEVVSRARDGDPKYDVTLEKLANNMKDLASGKL